MRNTLFVLLCIFLAITFQKSPKKLPHISPQSHFQTLSCADENAEIVSLCNKNTSVNEYVSAQSNVSYFEAESGRFKIKISSSTDEGKSYYYVYPTFSSDKTFTGDVYKRDADENYSKLGTATGVYTSSDAGTSGVTVSITFTSLPTGFTSYITTGEAYTLTAADSNFLGETLTQQ